MTQVAFVRNFWPATYGSINGVNWTLAVEMQFYLAVALLLPWLARARLADLARVRGRCVGLARRDGPGPW